MTIPASAEAPPTQRRDPKTISQTVSQASCLPLALPLRITPLCRHSETRAGRQHASLPFLRLLVVMPLSSCTSTSMPGRRCCTGMYLSWYSTRSPRYDVTCLFFQERSGNNCQPDVH